VAISSLLADCRASAVVGSLVILCRVGNQQLMQSPRGVSCQCSGVDLWRDLSSIAPSCVESISAVHCAVLCWLPGLVV